VAYSGWHWEENFAQMKPYIDRSLDALTYHRIVEYIRHFLDERIPLFTSRVRDGRIRDCQGDLRLQHVYVLDEPDFPAHRLAILDGIEFNERFRYSDVASEVAFLAMELEAADRYDLSRVFVDHTHETSLCKPYRVLQQADLCYHLLHRLCNLRRKADSSSEMFAFDGIHDQAWRQLLYHPGHTFPSQSSL